MTNHRSARIPSVGLLTVLATLCSSCSESSGEHAEGNDLRVREGELLVVYSEAPGPDGGLKYFLRQPDGVLPLHFMNTPELPSGTKVRLHGLDQDAEFRVTSVELEGSASTEVVALEQELVGQPLLRSRSIAFAKVDYGGGINRSDASIRSFMYSTTNQGPNLGIGTGDKSLVQYYAETSYGMFGMFAGSGPGVEGPFPYSAVACGGNGTGELARALTPKLSTTYDHRIWYYGTVQPNCGYGWGSQGTWSRPQGDIWFNGGLFDGAITHEIGHNLGFQHASTIDCGNVPFADDPMTCTTVEYGNTVSIMGNMGNGHMMGLEKWYAGWLLGCNGVRVRSSGTFTLFPIEVPCNGIQTLQIPMPKTSRTFDTEQSSGPNPVKFYYLELRTSQGLDTGQRNQVVVHASDDIKPQTSWCARNVQLDMNPATNAVDGMTAGQIFTDPAGGVTFKVDSLDATKATVTVTLSTASGSNTCIDGSPLVGSGPISCDGSGGAGGAGGVPSTGGGPSTGGVPTMGGAPSTGGASRGGATNGGQPAAGTPSLGGAGGSSNRGGSSNAGVAGGSTTAGRSNGGSSSVAGKAPFTTSGAGGNGAGGAGSGGRGSLNTGTGGNVVSSAGGDASTGRGGTGGVGSGSNTATAGAGLVLGGAASGSSRPPSSGGASDGSVTSFAGAAATLGDTAGDSSEDGCSCRIAGTHPSRNVAVLFAPILLALGSRRRRQQR